MQGVWKRSIAGQRLESLPTYGCADLDVELAHGVPVVHGVESSNLVYTHWRHLQYPRHLVHDADAAESVLALSEVEERHDGGLFVLRGVPGEDLLDKLLILGSEFEGNLEVVLGRVAMLQRALGALSLALRAWVGRKYIRH